MAPVRTTDAGPRPRKEGSRPTRYTRSRLEIIIITISVIISNITIIVINQQGFSIGAAAYEVHLSILWGGIKRGVGEIVVLEVISRWRISGQGGKCCIFGRGRCPLRQSLSGLLRASSAGCPAEELSF